MTNQNLVLLKTCPTAYEAGFLRDLLADNNIAAEIFDEHANRIMPHLNFMFGVRVMVRADDLSAAQSLVQLSEQSLRSDPEESPSEPVRVRAKVGVRVFIFCVVFVFVLAWIISLLGRAGFRN